METIEIYDNISGTLKDFFNTIEDCHIEEIVAPEMFYKGKNYIKNVKSINFTNNETLDATVQGTLLYAVSIFKQNGTVKASCNCPYESLAPCKHITAVLLRAVESSGLFGHHIDLEEKDLGAYLKSLSKDELIQLLVKWAPSDFYKYVKDKTSPTKQAESLLNKTTKAINRLFKDDDFLYDPIAFENKLIQLLNEISGLYEKIPQQIADLLIAILEEIEFLEEDGYLYQDYPEEVFDGERLEQFILEFLVGLDSQLKIDFITQLQRFSEHHSFEKLQTHLLDGITETEMLFFKDKFLENIKNYVFPDYNNVYLKIKPNLTENEIENALKILCNENDLYMVEYLSLLKENGKLGEAYKIGYSYVESNEKYHLDRKIYEILIDLLFLQNLEMEQPAIDILQKKPECELLEQIIKYLPEKQSVFETVLEEKSPEELLEFYEQNNRLTDAVALIERSDMYEETIYRFFKRHKKDFPKNAEKIFVSRIYQNLERTGDYYYEAIKTHLEELKGINKDKFDQMLSMIRKEYKRRRNLMALLQNM